MVEDQVNGDTLRQLREALGWDWAHIARLSSLSIPQVKELEQGGSACFYSLSIKNSAARKVAQVLGVSDTQAIIVRETPVAVQEESALTSHIAAPAQIASADVHPTTPYLSTWAGYGVMALLLLVGLGWFGSRPVAPASHPAWIASAPVTESMPLPSNATNPVVPPSSVLAVNPVPVEPTQAVPPLAPQQVLAKQEAAETELRPASVSLSADQSCSFEGDAAALAAERPSKSSDQVSVMLRKAEVVCVQDGTGKVWRESIQPWTVRTFTGKAPWKLYSTALSSADVFFQGKKIPVAAAQSHTVSLSAKPVIR